MVLQDFFEEKPTVIWTLEHLRSFMTSEIVGLEEEYDIGEAVIAESHDISRRNFYPIVLVALTLLSDRSQRDYLYFIPETNSMGLWYGAISFRAMTPFEVGTKFTMMLSSGEHVAGKIAMCHKQLCFQFKKDYNVKKNHS